MGELQDPVGYEGPWILLAVLALAAVALYYVVVLWATRPRRPQQRKPPKDVDYLARLDEIERAVRAGMVSARGGHQQVSGVVREFVSVAVGVPATTMALADLEREGPERLADVVALLYPPAFGTDDDLADRELPATLGRARELVTTW